MTIVVTAGLPGSGKSTIANRLSMELGYPVFSVDPIEAAMWQAGIPKDLTGIAAYQVAYVLADEQLKLGHSVIIDAVNAVEPARAMWRSLAKIHDARLVILECVCSDLAVHRKRVEARRRDIPLMDELTWEQVELRRAEYEPWQDKRLVLETCRDEDAVFREALTALDLMQSP